MKRRLFFPILIFASVCAGLALRWFVFDILVVSGNSMYPACKNGSRIAVNKLAYGLGNPFSGRLLVKWAEPQLNDIVIYLHDNKIVVKRCLGTTGMPLSFSENSVYSADIYMMKTPNGSIPLSAEQYRMIKNSPEVPQNRILAVGDNYEQSIDSRNYGFVSADCILGKVLCR
ncbi:MAG: signal peptidase I [Bacteroides sp.]|nr:signal peptidase I [Prevotella sp.]MCM1408749.1 signal peptidase I [Treponema brennaborense]MCM1470664.1 signal peptidase I [Bacteroides sp.]